MLPLTAKMAGNTDILPTAPFIAPKAGPGGEGQARLSRPTQRQFWSWFGWVGSVVVVSTIVSYARDALSLPLTRHARAPTARLAPPSASAFVISRRQDSCAKSGVNAAEYNVPMHVGALLIVLAVSSLACGLPMLAAKFPVLRIPANFFFAVRHFGTGVLLATAFVHLLPTAFVSLGDPCLSSFWTTDFQPMPGAIALFGIFFVAVIEMVFSPARQFTPRTSRQNSAIDLEPKADGRVTVRPAGGGLCGNADAVASVLRPSHGSHGPARRGSIEPAPEENRRGARALSPSVNSIEEGTAIHVLTAEQQHKKAILQCMMLEVGILFHSVFIGMALSIAVGGDFVVLLIAISFHRKSGLLQSSIP